MELNVNGVESNRLECNGIGPQAMEWNANGVESNGREWCEKEMHGVERNRMK